MLTEVKAYSSQESAPTLLLNDDGRPELDLLQVRKITGLDPVKANVNTAPFGSVDGSSYIGSSVDSRNIVLTIHPNPDWDVWSVEKLRELIYSYFMPKSATRLVFYSDEKSPVEIFGIVESCEIDPFSSDVEFLVSIICPDPYFTAIEETILTGMSTDGVAYTEIDYEGSIETGFNVQVTRLSTPDPTYIYVQVGDPTLSFFRVLGATVNATKYFEMNSIPGAKYVRNITLGSGIITNLLGQLAQGSQWPVLKPGSNDFSVITNSPGHQSWQLSYLARYGGL